MPWGPGLPVSVIHVLLKCCLGTQTWIVSVLFRLEREAQKEASEGSILMKSIAWFSVRLSKGKLVKHWFCTAVSIFHFHINSITVSKHQQKQCTEQNPFKELISWRISWSSSSYLKRHVCHFPWEDWTEEICFFVGVIFLNSRFLYRCAIARAQIFVFQIRF